MSLITPHPPISRDTAVINRLLRTKPPSRYKVVPALWRVTVTQAE